MDHLFREVPPTKKSVELKEEILQNLVDKYHDLINEGKNEEAAYAQTVQGAVGGAAGVVHTGGTIHTDCEPNRNVEAMRICLDKAGIESRPLWKPMHKQPVFKNSPAYTNDVAESLFKRGLCLPSGPMVTDEDVNYIIENIKNNIL